MKIDAQYEYMPNSTLLISTALPAKERLLVAQTFTLAVIFSTRPLHSMIMMGATKNHLGFLDVCLEACIVMEALQCLHDML